MSDELKDVTTYLSHLEKSRFNGTVLVTFSKGKPTHLSRKEDLIVGGLAESMRKSVFVVRKSPLELPKETGPEEAAEAGEEGTK